MDGRAAGDVSVANERLGPPPYGSERKAIGVGRRLQPLAVGRSETLLLREFIVEGAEIAQLGAGPHRQLHPELVAAVGARDILAAIPDEAGEQLVGVRRQLVDESQV